MWLFFFFIGINLYFAYMIHVVRMKILQEVVFIKTTLSLREVNLNQIKNSVNKVNDIIKFH